MSDLELAREQAGAAERNVSALRGMGDAAVFADEIFGFHVQQAAEMLPGLPPLEKILELHPPSPLHRPRQSHDPLLPGFGSQSRTGQMACNRNIPIRLVIEKGSVIGQSLGLKFPVFCRSQAGLNLEPARPSVRRSISCRAACLGSRPPLQA